MKDSYRIYGKDEDMKRFSPLDLTDGQFVTNLIYASVWTDLDIVTNKCKELNEMNDTMTFEVRKV
jgi:hypothetical protein